MELKDATRMKDWTGVLFAGGIGLTMTCILELMAALPLLKSFVYCAGLGYLLMDWMGLDAQLQAKQEEVVDLEKQVLVLKSAMHELTVRFAELEGKYRKAYFRNGPVRSLSTSSF